MIIYGTRGKLIKSEMIAEPCANCNNANSIEMNVFQRWAHIFWIPFFPIGKTGVSQCMHCKQVLTLKQMPEMLRISYSNLKSQAKTPIWTFSGLLLLAIIIVAVIITGKQKDERVKAMISALKANDVLEIKLDDGNYTLAKVSRVKGDSVFIVVNKFQTDKASGIDKLKKEAYDAQEEVLTVEALKSMNAKNQILDIERD